MPEFLIYYSKSLSKELEIKNLGIYIVYLYADRDQLIDQINNDIYYKLHHKNKKRSIENENFIKKYKVKARKTDIPESIWKNTILNFTEKLFVSQFPSNPEFHENFLANHGYTLKEIDLTKKTQYDPNWINVKDDLPTNTGGYLCRRNDGEILVCTINTIGHWTAFPGGKYYGDITADDNKNPYFKITHWRPLPVVNVTNEFEPLKTKKITPPKSPIII